MLNRSAIFAMSTSVLKALPGKLDIKRHSPSILYIPHNLLSAFIIGTLRVKGLILNLKGRISKQENDRTRT